MQDEPIEIVNQSDAEAIKQQNREYWQMARDAKNEKKLLKIAGFSLLVLTLYFGVANFIVIIRNAPQPYKFMVEAVNSNDYYTATLIWNETNSAENIIRPAIIINDGITMQQSVPVPIEFNKEYKISISIPENCTLANHKGIIALKSLESKNSGLPPKEIRLDIEVNGGWWNAWFVLRNWLIVSIIIMALIYLACIIFFTKPFGKIRFTEPEMKFLKVSPTDVELKMMPVAWFLPWRRSTVPLKWIWKEAGILGVLPDSGEILFIWKSIAPMIYLPDSDHNVEIKKAGDWEDMEPSINAGALEHMDEERPLAYIDRNDNSMILFGFISDKINY